jgi:maleylacetoacetate isomerase
MLQLHTFAMSSASYRVRIVLALKGIAWEGRDVPLSANAHLQADYTGLNPQSRVPLLVTEHGSLSQSLAIIDWLEEAYLDRQSIYPADPWTKALCRAFAHVIASDVFPLQNLSTRRKLQSDYGVDDEGQANWSRDWIARGFAALEAETAARGWSPELGYLFGDYPTLADICLVPQMNNARRYNVDLSAFPLLVAADSAARAHPAFVSAAS